MIAHSMGMGLYEKRKLNWLTEDGWRLCGYTVEEEKDSYILGRRPLRRFEDIEEENVFEMIPSDFSDYSDFLDEIESIIKSIQQEYDSFVPDDLAIILNVSKLLLLEQAEEIK